MQQFDTLLIDADSIAYAAGDMPSLEECQAYLSAKIRKIMSDTGVDPSRTTGYVEAWDWKHNFRSHVATTRPYKGNRKGKPKPALVNEAKKYLVDSIGFRLARHYESEEYCMMQAVRIGAGRCCIAYTDKDLLQFSGWKHNYRTGETHCVSERDAMLNLYKQIISGDSSDNIPGCPGAGVKADYSEMEDTCLTHAQCQLHVAKRYRRKGMPYSYMLEQARLVYLLRRPDEVFTFDISPEMYEEIDP